MRGGGVHGSGIIFVLVLRVFVFHLSDKAAAESRFTLPIGCDFFLHLKMSVNI